MTGWAIGLAVVALVVVAVAVAVVVARRGPGPLSGGRKAPPAALPPDLAAAPGGLVLLLFSASFQRSCRDAAAVLADVTVELPRVTHRVLDVAARPELSARLGVEATPTTLLVDAAGAELLRVAGVPRRRELAAAIEAHLV